MTSSKKFRFAVTALSGNNLKNSHTYGEVCKPEKWELRKVVTTLKQAHPDCEPAFMFVQTMESYYFEDDIKSSSFHTQIAGYFPYLLAWFRGRKLGMADKACLWVVACYWYHHCGGPYPGSEVGTHKRVKTDIWKKDLFCPICNTPMPLRFVPKPKTDDPLEKYAQWLIKHRPLCQRKLNPKRALALTKQAEKLHTEREQRHNLYFENLLKLGEVGKEIEKQLLKQEAELDRLYKEREQVQALQVQQDDAQFKAAVTKAEIARKKGLEPLSYKEQLEYAKVKLAITRINELLDQIKGQRGVQAQRESLQKDLREFQKIYNRLEERRIYAGELK